MDRLRSADAVDLSSSSGVSVRMLSYEDAELEVVEGCLPRLKLHIQCRSTKPCDLRRLTRLYRLVNALPLGLNGASASKETLRRAPA